jgi:hypothetical protein
VGKFNPSFSRALDNRYYGVCGTSIVNDYQLLEKLGFYVAMILPSLRVQANFFRNDTTFLSHSLLTDRGAYSLKGDVGNVSNILDNFSVTATLSSSSSLGLSFAFRELATSDPEKKSEFGYLLGLDFTIDEAWDRIGAAPALELVALHNSGGNPRADVFYALASLPLFYDRWNFGISWSARVTRDGDTRVSQLFQGSIGYMFRNGLTVDFSRKYEDGHSTSSTGEIRRDKLSSWGVSLSYRLKFE